MPGWSLSERMLTGAAPTSPDPVGEVLWTKGDYQVVDDGGGKMLTAGNAAPGFNPGWRERGGAGGDGPLLGLETLNGVPGFTYPLASGTNVISLLEPADGSGAVHLKDRNGVNIGYGPGETQSLTYYAVVIPRLLNEFGGLIGGTIFRLGNTAGGGQLDLELIFRIFVPDLPPVGAESLTIYSNDWTTDYADAVYGPSTPAATYQDLPLLLQFVTTARNDLRCFVSGPGIGTKVPIALAPGTLPIVSTHTHNHSSWGSPDNILPGVLLDRWFGGRYEDLAKDYDVTTNPAAELRDYRYFAGRFPAIGIVT
jgi:hypothetical protein